MIDGIVILAGGESKRMGTPKAWLNLGGKPVVQYVLTAVSGTGLPIVIIANDNRFHTLGVPIFPDWMPGLGPMGGLLTALNHTSWNKMLVVACDTPFLTTDDCNYILQQVRPDDKITVVETPNGLETLTAVYHRDCQSYIEELLTNHQRALQQLIKAMGKKVNRILPPDNPHWNLNVNTPADWALCLSLHTTQPLTKAMQTTVLLFGQLASVAGANQIFIPAQPDTPTLRAYLNDRFPDLRELPYAIAIENRICQEPARLLPEAPIALLPPYSGG